MNNIQKKYLEAKRKYQAEIALVYADIENGASDYEALDAHNTRERAIELRKAREELILWAGSQVTKTPKSGILRKLFVRYEETRNALADFCATEI